MNFKQYLQELNLIDATSDFESDVRDSINNRLDVELDQTITTPEVGLQKIRKVLLSYGIDMPVLYGIDPEGDELAIELVPNVHLYIIYAPNDDGQYEFHSEVVDNDGLEEILEDEEDIEDE